MSDKKPTFYDVGYYDGFHRKKEASSNPDYRRGYLDGEVHREERENGFDPIREGRQW